MRKRVQSNAKNGTEDLTDRDAEIPAWIPEKYFLTLNFEAL